MSKHVTQLEKDLAEVLNRHSAENGSDTPDFILATYLMDCLAAFNKINDRRQKWYGHALCINGDMGGSVKKLRRTGRPI